MAARPVLKLTLNECVLFGIVGVVLVCALQVSALQSEKPMLNVK